jgi:hypothetical protein
LALKTAMRTSVLLVSLLAAACNDGSAGDDASSSSGSPSGTGGAGGSGGDSGNGGGETGGSGGGAPILCVEPRGEPVVHKGAVEADEVWAADQLHVVEGILSVRKGAKLTIDPCATVRFAENAGLSIAYPGSPTTGTLIAEGDAQHPIRFEGRDGARWGHVLLDAGATARLAHLTMAGGGGDELLGATLVVYGDQTLPTKRNAFVDHLEISGSRGAGVHLDRLAGFADHSTDLTVVGSGDETNPYPVVTDEHGLGTLPRGSYTGNAIDAIFVDPDARLQESATMKNLGVPYRVGTFPNDHFSIGGGFGKPLATLTIEPGVRIEMHPGTSFEIEHSTGEMPASGALVAEGTAAEPIVFTSSASSPAPGSWQGLWFGGIPSAANSIEHARIEYTGADCGCILLTCSAIEQFEGAVIFSMQPPSAFIRDSEIVHGSSHGVVLGYDGASVDFKDGNTFDVAGCAQTLPRQATCPNPKPACE